MVLSKIDAKVLRFACDNGLQMGDAEIAKHLRLKPSTVSYALKKMRRLRIILSHRYRLDYAKLGFPAKAWVLFRLKIGGARSYQALETLLSFPQVHVASFITGTRDVAIKLFDRDVVAINQRVLQLGNELQDTIESPDVLFCTKTFKTHNTLLHTQQTKPLLDAIDFEILNKRMLHSEAELKDIARMLILHRNTVSKRWKQLWQEQVLLKKTPVVNPDFYPQLGMGFKAILFIDTGSSGLQKAATSLAKMPAVHELNQLLSGHDLMAIVRVKDVAEYFALLKEIGTRLEPKATVSRIILHSKPHKPNYLAELSKAGAFPFKLSQEEASQ